MNNTTVSNRSMDLIPKLNYMRHLIEKEHGDVVSVDSKLKPLEKFGKTNEASAIETTIMDLPSGTSSETYVSSNSIDTLSSDNTSNTQAVIVEGHTLAAGDFTFVTQTAALNGQNKVILGTPLAIISRVFNVSDTDFATGSYIYGFEDDTLSLGVPQTDTKIHIIVNATENQSTKCATTLSSMDYFIVTYLLVSIGKKTTAQVNIRLRIREPGGVFRSKFVTGISTGGTGTYNLVNEPLYIPKNSDVKVTATASASGVEVTARLGGYLAEIVT